MDIIRLHKCLQCGKTWYPRRPGTPRICPTCKTTYWNTGTRPFKAVSREKFTPILESCQRLPWDSGDGRLELRSGNTRNCPSSEKRAFDTLGGRKYWI